MFHLSESLYKEEEMPARARKLFIDTFRKYHKLNAGDEDVPFKMAKEAVEKKYVKIGNQWIPKKAAEEIVRHDLEEGSDSDEITDQEDKEEEEEEEIQEEEEEDNFDDNEYSEDEGDSF
jgi:ChaB